ncbi:MAG TPA: SIS domain-containing protein [Longimicrobiales bacterium]|jgi:D-sedoheptulose 7-phosphate isomerase
MDDSAHLVREGLEELSRLADRVARELDTAVAMVGALTVDALRGGRRLFFCGNGGSAADAQHLAAEYVIRFGRDRAALPALALTVDTSVLTAGANDLGFSEVFSRQIQALARPGDILFLHSTSGNSANLLRAAAVAREMGVITVALLAKGGGSLRDVADHALVIPTDVTARAQEMHLAVGHAICDIVDRAFSETGDE